jgi:hypothetical protein
MPQRVNMTTEALKTSLGMTQKQIDPCLAEPPTTDSREKRLNKCHAWYQAETVKHTEARRGFVLMPGDG